MQERLTASLAQLYETSAENREVLRLAMAAVGRGGTGDAGQRIRDEILVIQQTHGVKVRVEAR